LVNIQCSVLSMITGLNVVGLFGFGVTCESAHHNNPPKDCLR
jgi:hypothetical protein